MEEKIPHSLSLQEREKLTMTGVWEVLRFDEESVVLRTSLGALLVRGTGLKLKCLSLDGGRVEVEGSICGLQYAQPREKNTVWSRLFG